MIQNNSMSDCLNTGKLCNIIIQLMLVMIVTGFTNCPYSHNNSDTRAILATVNRKILAGEIFGEPYR